MLVLQASGMVASILAARILGKHAFGQLSIVRSTVTTFAVFAGSGLSMATTKCVAEFRTIDRKRAGELIGFLLNTAFFLSGLATLICFATAMPLASRAMNAASLAGPLRIGALLLVLQTVSGVQLGALAGLEEFRAVSLLSALEGVLTIAAVVGGAWLFGIAGALGGFVLAAVIAYPAKQLVLRARCAAAGIPISHHSIGGKTTMIWTLLLPSLLLAVSAQPFEWLGRIMLARQRNGYGELAVFSAAYAWGQAVSLIASQITSPSLPILANMYAARDRAGFLRLLKVVAMLTATCGLVAALPLMLLSKWILRAYGPAFVDGWPVLIVIALAFSVASLSSLLRAVLVATGQWWWQNVHAAIWGATLLGSLWLLSSRGAMGLALSYLIAFCVIIVTQGISAARAVSRVSSAEPVVVHV